MKILKRFGSGLPAVIAPPLAVDAVERASVPHVPSSVAPAEAIVGCPLTPVS